MTKPAVAIVETGSQVRMLLNDATWRSRVDVWLAAGSEAAWHLQMNGIKYAKIEDFYEESSLGDRAEDVFMRQVAWADWVDGWLQDEIPQFKQYKIQPGRTHFPFLKRFFDQLEITAYQLHAFLKGCQPAELLFFDPPPDDPTTQVRFLGSVMGKIIPILAKQNNVKATAIPDSRARVVAFTGQASPSRLRRIADHLPSSLLKEFSLFSKLGMVDYLRLAPCRLWGKDRILVVKSGYDVDPVLPKLAHSNFCLHFNARVRARRDALVRKTLGALWNRVVTYEDFWVPLPMQGQEMRSLAGSRLSYWWHHVVPEIWEVFMAARTTLQAKGFTGLVSASPGGAYRHKDIAVILAARSLGIPVIMYQHGGFVGACQNLAWDLTDLWQADYELCYGEGVSTYFEKRSASYEPRLAKSIPIGSARLDHVRHRRPQRREAIRKSLRGDDSRPLVLYVPTAFCGPYRNLLRDSYSDVAYFELQQRVLDVFRSACHVRLIYKAFKGTYLADLVPEIIKHTVPNGVVIDNISLTDLVWAVDAVIVDFPSTGLLEVLMTRKPVLVYADKHSLHMFEDAKTLLRKRAVLAETAEEFVAEVEGFVKNGNFVELPAPDDTFLRAYGTHMGDGCSAVRATEAIELILRNHSTDRMAGNTASAFKATVLEGSR